MSNKKWTYMQKLAMVFAVLLAVSFIANVILAGYINEIESRPKPKSYKYIVGVVYEEVRFYSKPDIHGAYMSWLRKVPVYNVKVTLEDANCYTGQCGYFSFTTVQGTTMQNTYEVKFEKKGYYTEHRIVYVYSLEYIEVEMKQKIVLKGGD